MDLVLLIRTQESCVLYKTKDIVRLRQIRRVDQRYPRTEVLSPILLQSNSNSRLDSLSVYRLLLKYVYVDVFNVLSFHLGLFQYRNEHTENCVRLCHTPFATEKQTALFFIVHLCCVSAIPFVVFLYTNSNVNGNVRWRDLSNMVKTPLLTMLVCL